MKFCDTGYGETVSCMIHLLATLTLNCYMINCASYKPHGYYACIKLTLNLRVTHKQFACNTDALITLQLRCTIDNPMPLLLSCHIQSLLWLPTARFYFPYYKKYL